MPSAGNPSLRRGRTRGGRAGVQRGGRAGRFRSHGPYLIVDRGRGPEKTAEEEKVAVAAAAEGGRRRRRCCGCRSWWVAVSASARAGERARSRGRRAAQARAAGARGSPGEGGEQHSLHRNPLLRPPVGASEPHRSALRRLLARALRAALP
ncbi:uncharacterized protein LOC128571137 [Nycticebus coucang]|uniref:uncharacterized protein LOC128571137 n=1 Tax=Nycticebus coucang TaxID=9470 RepID=UPI00234D07FA|nr:uncharacterized protein LOC128571137 [Nycticebus coucang]